MKCETIQIEDLFNTLLSQKREVHQHNDYDVIDASGVQILTHGNRYVDLVWVSRHKTNKHLLNISVEYKNQHKNVIVTTDHVCMVYTDDHFFENTSAKDLCVNRFVSIYDSSSDSEMIGTIVSIDDLGETTEYVYDCEVADDEHTFYANDILIHNSQFVNLQCVTDWMKRKYGLTTNVRDWEQKYKNELWKDMCDFVDNNVNPHVRGLIHDYCHTNNQNVLTYELEYMSACMLAESKKHYATYKMFDEGDIVKKIKYSGIELKKATVPKEVKAFLKDFYEGVLLYDWTQKDYDDYVFDLYQKFSSFGIDEISFWKGYNTAREAVGFLQMQKGATGISRCCTHYNQLIDKLGIAKKYDSIRVGDHVRMLYLDENNPYRINCIAYKPGQWPKEFNKLFKPDYHTMFNKIILDPLKKFRLACKFNDTDPSKQVEVDIFSM